MEEKLALDFLTTIGNPDLLRHWHTLQPEQKKNIFAQLQQIDIPTLRLQQRLILQPQTTQRKITPFTHYSLSGNSEDAQCGLELISKGQVGCLLLAGGQGSRLRIDGPKGICAVSKVCKKSLFQLFAEKTLAAGKQVKRPLLLAIMTSPLNHAETVSFFEKNDLFGLDKKQLSFFQQKNLPLLDREGNLFLETKDHLSEGPDGNGASLERFFECGLGDEWRTQGIQYLNCVLIDNALADPFDAELIGYQARRQSDIVIKCVMRKNPEEKVGVIVQENGKIAVIEYSEMSNEERLALNLEMTLLHPLANISLFSFKMKFVAEVEKNLHPIFHKSFKAVNFLNKDGVTIKAEQPMAWKFERFLFDTLSIAPKVEALVYPRENCFAPLKNFSGNDSFDSVVSALEHRDRQIISAITGSSCLESPLELAQDFYYPDEELLKKWRGKKLTHGGYIENL